MKKHLAAIGADEFLASLETDEELWEETGYGPSAYGDEGIHAMEGGYYEGQDGYDDEDWYDQPF